MAKQAQSLIGRLDQKVFDAIYSRSLVYNALGMRRPGGLLGAVDFCIAIVEHEDGRMELVHWRESDVLGEDL